MILKLFEDASCSKINFSKRQACAQVPLKYLELTLVTLFSIWNSRWDKISEGIVKNSYLEQSETLFES